MKNCLDKLRKVIYYKSIIKKVVLPFSPSGEIEQGLPSLALL